MLKFALSTIAAFSLTFSSPARATDLDAREIMARNETARKLDDLQAKARLTQLSQGKDAKIKEFAWKRKLSSNQKDYRTFVRFEKPATVRNEGILILENDGGENEVLLYLPAYKKIRRVENQQQTSKFMGSEFSYSDLATPHLSDYQYSGGKKAPCPAEAGIECYVVEAKPANRTVAERTGYSRIVNHIRSDRFVLVQAEYFDPQGKPLKRLEASDFEAVPKDPGKWVAKKTRMTHLPSGNTSTIELSDLRLNAGVADSTFTQQNLSRVQ